MKITQQPRKWWFLSYRNAAIAATVAFVTLLGCAQKTATRLPARDPQVPPARLVNAAAPESGTMPQFNGEAALHLVREIVGFGPRWVGSPGHRKTEALLRTQLKGYQLEEDAFSASTPAGPKQMRNFIAKIPGSQDCIIVVAGHYDTLYERHDFVGANDGGSSTGLLLQLARELKGHAANLRREGCSVWLAWLDGEEAFRFWSESDSLYGSRHLAEKWQLDGTLKRIRALLLVDMVGDADLNIERDANSSAWLEDLVYRAASAHGYQSRFFARTVGMEDDHTPFAKLGVPVADLIDFNYGYGNAFWHTKEDTLDKLSARSLQIVGSVVLQSIRMLDRK